MEFCKILEWISSIIVQNEVSKKMGVKVPEEVIKDYLETKWKVTEQVMECYINYVLF